MNLGLAAGNLVQVNHLIQFDESVSNPTNEPKWEPCPRMGIYVGCSQSHAANVSLIINPQTGHISPQFHVVYNDDFTMVPYLRNATVHPHWAEIVKASSTIKLYTERQVGTWQMLPELDAEIGDFTSDTSSTSCPSINLEGEEQTCPSEDLDCEGEARIEATLPVNHNHNNQQVAN
jgi:hypothetical protein